MPSVDTASALLNRHKIIGKPTPCKCGKGRITVLTEPSPDQWVQLYCVTCKATTPGAVDMEGAVKQWNALQLIS